MTAIVNLSYITIRMTCIDLGDHMVPIALMYKKLPLNKYSKITTSLSTYSRMKLLPNLMLTILWIFKGGHVTQHFVLSISAPCLMNYKPMAPMVNTSM